MAHRSNPNRACFFKSSFIETTRPIYLGIVYDSFHTTAAFGYCKKGPHGSQNLKCLLSGPLQKKIADPYSGAMHLLRTSNKILIYKA